LLKDPDIDAFSIIIEKAPVSIMTAIQQVLLSLKRQIPAEDEAYRFSDRELNIRHPKSKTPII